MSRRVGSLLVVLFAASCGGGLYSQLKSQVSSDLDCPEDQVRHEYLGGYKERVTACGHTLVYWYKQGRWLSVLDRASFDLGCGKSELTVSELGEPAQAGVSGCGKKATYVYTTSGWIQNSDVRPE